MIILGLLLRAVVAPLILIGTVVLSFGAALGLSVLAFQHIFGFAGAGCRAVGAAVPGPLTSRRRGVPSGYPPGLPPGGPAPTGTYS